MRCWGRCESSGCVTQQQDWSLVDQIWQTGRGVTTTATKDSNYQLWRITVITALYPHTHPFHQTHTHTHTHNPFVKHTHTQRERERERRERRGRWERERERDRDRDRDRDREREREREREDRERERERDRERERERDREREREERERERDVWLISLLLILAAGFCYSLRKLLTLFELHHTVESFCWIRWRRTV